LEEASQTARLWSAWDGKELVDKGLRQIQRDWENLRELGRFRDWREVKRDREGYLRDSRVGASDGSSSTPNSSLESVGCPICNFSMGCSIDKRLRCTQGVHAE
jgi:hypothetical protein